MVEFRNSDDFENWLKGRSREEAVALAARIALRVAPFTAEGRRELIFVTMRATLISSVASTWPTEDIRVAAAAAADAAARAARAAAAVLAADAAARAADATLLEQGASVEDLMSAPLWFNGEPDWFVEASREFLDKLAKDPAFAFWRRWYQSLRDGGEHNWPLWREIALIDPKVWDAGPEAVAEEIARIEEDYRAQPPDSEIYREQVKRLLSQAAVIDYTARASADLLQGLLESWRAVCGNQVPDELLTFEKIPPAMRNIAAAVMSEGQDREERLQEELERLRALVVQLRADVEARERSILHLQQVNEKLASAQEVLAGASATKPKTLARMFVESGVKSAGGAAGVALAAGAYHLAASFAPTLLGPLLDFASLDFLRETAPNAPVEALPPADTLET